MRPQHHEFDQQLQKHAFLQRHYECLPFIGENYKETRLLLIGESHYVPGAEVHCVNREDFYDVSFDDLTEGEYKDWINTRRVFEYRVYDRENLKGFFANPATEMAGVLHPAEPISTDRIIEAMHHYAFMNYFKRPAYDAGQTIKGLTRQDYRYAYDVSRYIMDVLQPTHIIFVSKKAYYAFCASATEDVFAQYSIACVSHPSSAWWNRKRKDGRCAREDFRDFVAEIL